MSTPHLIRDFSKDGHVSQQDLKLTTHDIKGAQPKKINQVYKGLKRRNFFEQNQIENLHLKDKYGRKNFSTNPISHNAEMQK